MAEKSDGKSLQTFLIFILILFAFPYFFLSTSCTTKQIETQNNLYNEKQETDLSKSPDDARVRKLRELEMVKRKQYEDSLSEIKDEEGHNTKEKSALTNQITFQREYTYQASEADSKLSCRIIALEQVKRLLLEELGVYIESTFEDRCTRENSMTKNEIITLTAGIVQTEIVAEKWDGQIYWLKARIVADPNEVIKSVEALRKNQFMKEALERQKEESQELLNEIERLRNELSSSKESVQADKLAKHRDAVHKLSANDCFEKAYAFACAGKYQSAIESYNNAIELNPYKVLFYLERSSAYVGCAIEHLNKKEYSKAIESCQHAINDTNRILEAELNEQIVMVLDHGYNCRAEARNILASAYAQFGKQDDATFYYLLATVDSKMALDLFPSSHAYYNLGRAYIGLKQLKEGIKALNRALQIDPKHEGAGTLIVWAYNLYEASQEDPDTPCTIYPSMQAGRLYHSGKYNEAIAYLNKAIKIDPEDAYSYHLRGICYLKLGSYQQALRDLDKAIELNPKDKKAYFWRSTIYAYQLDNYEQAIRDSDNYMELEPEKAKGYMVRCNYHFMFENYQKAIMDCNKAIELNPDVAGFYWVRAKVYERLGNHQQAINDCKIAARLGEKEAQDYLRSEGIKY